MNKHSLEAMLDLATSLGRWHGKISYPVLPYHASQAVSKLQRLARSLHKRYGAKCSYQWADNDVYRKRTASLEKKAHELAVSQGGLARYV